MPDFQAIGRNGVKLTEDGGAEKAYIEAGPHDVRALTATTTLDATDHGKIITNEGAAGAASARPITMPECAAGLCIRAYIHNANGQRFVARAGDTIRIGNMVSKAAGYVECAQVGAWLTFWGINATEWVAEPTTDPWTVEES